MPNARRWTVAVAGVLGAIGVAAAAAASHGEDARYAGAAASVALAHGPALLALGLAAPQGRFWTVGALLLALGALGFCLDMGALILAGSSPVPLLAPVSGVLMIAGWLTVAGLATLIGRK